MGCTFEPRTDDAIAMDKQSIEADPSYAPGHFKLALHAARSGNAEEVEQRPETLIKIEPSCAPAHGLLAVLKAEAGDNAAANAAIERATEFLDDWQLADVLRYAAERLVADAGNGELDD